jgi:signal peptidase II
MKDVVQVEEFGNMKTKFVTLLIILIFFLDQLTKRVIDQALTLKQSITILPNILYFTKAYNTGASFSILQGQQWFFILFAFLVIIAIIYYYKKIPINNRLFIAFILAGTIGNLVDRLQYGYVIDFIDFKIWPVFNIADTAVCIGAAGLIYYILKDDKSKNKNKKRINKKKK